MRSVLIAILACALPVRALADSTVWDGTYERQSGGGTELCPKSSGPVSVVRGAFSIVWNVDIRDKPVPVGRIDGTVSASGDVTLAIKLTDPVPAAVVAMVGETSARAELDKAGNGIKLAFRSSSSNRELRLSGGMCYASWTASPAPRSEPAAIEEPPTPAPNNRAKTTSKAKAPASKAPASKAPKAAAKPTKATPPAAKPAKATPAKATAVRSDGGRSGSSTPSPGAAKKEPRKRGSSNGATCSYDSDCASDHCEYRKCASNDSSSKKLGNGFECSYADDCASGSCDYHKCTSRDSGRKELGTGADCVYGSDCASGSCNYHKCVDD